MTTPSTQAAEGDLAEQWAAATLTPDDVGESPYEDLPSVPAEVDPADFAEQARDVPFDDDER